jgi:hypothetical protein
MSFKRLGQLIGTLQQRRSKDGFVSATGMFKIAFPWAKHSEEKAEREHLKSKETTSQDEVAGNVWISPELGTAAVPTRSLRNTDTNKPLRLPQNTICWTGSELSWTRRSFYKAQLAQRSKSLRLRNSTSPHQSISYRPHLARVAPEADAQLHPQRSRLQRRKSRPRGNPGRPRQ